MPHGALCRSLLAILALKVKNRQTKSEEKIEPKYTTNTVYNVFCLNKNKILKP